MRRKEENMTETWQMGQRLPKAFLERMQSFLGEEYTAFVQSYENERSYGMRRNPLKGDEEAFCREMPFTLEKVSWAKEGFYCMPQEQPGRHVLHEIGAYYIQEPSAMAVVEILDPQPGELILDLCAAPGGKSTQIAGRMQGSGLLLSNEIVPARAKILAQNIERMGIRNCVVCNEPPRKLAGYFPGYFDRIVVDAPCSGEGMFRKDETAIAEWSPEHVQMCAARQMEILEEAAGMLKAGGVLVYSTCTFAPEENEEVISRFLQKHPDFTIEEVAHDEAFEAGKGSWMQKPHQDIDRAMRLMPHKLRGEGHFIARLCRMGSHYESPAPGSTHEKTLEKLIQPFLTKELGLSGDWLAEQKGSLRRFGEQIYLVPGYPIELRGLHVLRPGLHLGTDKKNRIEPSHALALALHPQETERIWEITPEEAVRYIRGEGLQTEQTEKGWFLLCLGRYPVGFGKASGGQLKNHYPKGLRKDLIR